MECFECNKYIKEVENLKIDIEILINELFSKDKSNIVAKNVLKKHFDIEHNLSNKSNKFYITKVPVRSINYK